MILLLNVDFRKTSLGFLQILGGKKLTEKLRCLSPLLSKDLPIRTAAQIKNIMFILYTLLVAFV
jgi:hypothetical protein